MSTVIEKMNKIKLEINFFLDWRYITIVKVKHVFPENKTETRRTNFQRSIEGELNSLREEHNSTKNYRVRWLWWTDYFYSNVLLLIWILNQWLNCNFWCSNLYLTRWRSWLIWEIQANPFLKKGRLIVLCENENYYHY